MEKDHHPKRINRLIKSVDILAFCVVVLLLGGCPSPDDTDFITDFVPAGNQVFPLATDGATEITYTVNLGNTPRDLYFVLTNPALTPVSLPTVTSASLASTKTLSETAASDFFRKTEQLPGGTIIGRGLRDRPDLLDWTPPALIAARGIIPAAPEPSFDTVGQTAAGAAGFNTGEASLVDATCRAVRTYHGVTLNIWVADDCWYEGGTKSYLITENTNTKMVTAMADAFLKDGPGNDIYEWITGIFGVQWGDHVLSYMLPPENSEITILLYDIGNDDNVFETNGYTAGFFHPKDNYLQSYQSESNERIMFYLDAPAFASPFYGADGNWDIDDPLPQDQISTLAHEFQHMIMFYQKYVRHFPHWPETWLNEMCSLMAEDLVADKMGVVGPRGVAPDDGSAGGANNTGGRLPLFNYLTERSLTTWNSNPNETLPDYAAAYAFGAYLGRNYGGAEIFRHIVQSAYEGVDAVTAAIPGNPGFPLLLQNWGVSALLSDQTSDTAAVADRRYNRGDWFIDVDGYRLGSINLYNYNYNDGSYTQIGPFVYYPGYIAPPYFLTTTQSASSNILVKAAAGATGIVEFALTLGEGISVAAVVKDTP